MDTTKKLSQFALEGLEAEIPQAKLDYLAELYEDTYICDRIGHGVDERRLQSAKAYFDGLRECVAKYDAPDAEDVESANFRNPTAYYKVISDLYLAENELWKIHASREEVMRRLEKMMPAAESLK